ncbi:AAA family ATPase [Clostridium scatologenes]|uniref:Capsular polysaccharide biosynthesis protein n=1 Tax=Clostridium scatologenes TaxID=1548 RepID=A0A0E3M7K7_CLOSL|nr:Wzz/FepE/Etk N-terminal domain-containing protein [Clostridium scatologenes]AKA67153.1 capsular polysaccharide biosynthesis protein [Clostridium scatologenes]
MENANGPEYLSLIDIIKMLKKRIWFILLITILCTGIMTIKALILSKPMYEAHSTAIIVKGDTSIVQDSKIEPQYTQNDILLYEKIIDTYVQIAQSNLVIDRTAEELGDYSSLQLKKIITAIPISSSKSSSTGNADNTQIIQLNAVSSNKDEVAKIANVYCKNFIEQSIKILPVGKIEVLDQAETPITPIVTNNSKDIVVGFLFGLMLSVSIVFFRNYTDSLKIRNEKQVKDILNIPVVITIENQGDKKMKKNNKRDYVIEKYRLLRNFVENYNKIGFSCISVTSNSDAEGKETIAKNLAMSLAVYGKKTLFVDCTLSRISKIQSFDLGTARELIDILKDIDKLKDQQVSKEKISEISLRSCIKRTSCEYLSVASIGNYNLDGYNFIVKTEYLKIIMEFLKKKFDYIIIDTPSFSNLSYTQVITGAADACLFVLKEGINEVTKGEMLKDKINTIGCRMLGCILNKEKDPTKIFDNKNSSFASTKIHGRKEKSKIEKSINIEA